MTTATATAKTTANKWSTKRASESLRWFAALINAQRIEINPPKIRKADINPKLGKPLGDAVEPEVIYGITLLPPGELVIPDGPGGSGKSRTKRHEPERLEFLRSLGPVQMIARNSKNGARSYAGFVFNTPSGLVAMMDSTESENAMYVFNAKIEGWIELAKLDKHKIRSSRHAAFVKRIFHQGDWRSEVKRLLGKK